VVDDIIVIQSSCYVKERDLAVGARAAFAGDVIVGGPGTGNPEGLTCGEAVVDTLVRHGVEVVFGIPATHTLAIYESLGRSAIRHITPRHEQGAGYAADAYARATGKPGVCIVTTGPGILNLAAAAGTAYADSVPMLLISPGVSGERNGRDTGFLHEVKNQSAALANIVAWSWRAESLEEVGRALTAAFEHFATKRPRPVHVEIALDTLDGDERMAPWPPSAPQPAPALGPAQIQIAVDRLLGARVPAMLVGGGAIGAADGLVPLAERLDAVVVTTCNGKGTVPEDHPLTLGAALRLEPARSLLCESDVVLAIGTEIAESDLWIERLELSGDLVRVDIDDDQLQKNARSCAPILGRAETVVPELLRSLGAGPQGVDMPGRARASAARRLILEAREIDGAPFADLHHRLRESLAPDAIVTGDSAQVSYYGTVHYLPMSRPRQFLYPAGFAPLGYGLPAAIGAKVAFPDRQVVCVMGDGGLMFTVGEIATAVECRLGIPVIVYNNGGYGEIKDQMIARGSAPIGVDLATPDFTSLARAFGGHGIRLGGLASFSEAVHDALARDVPTLIEIVG
jgi:thiamine pyrophosphate-dependent acetolactate synthase large subunit-like protein